MTKKALIIICLLILVPILLTAYLVWRYFEDNPVVAKFGGEVGVINYRGKILRAVPGDEDYLFRYGDYLGKVGDKITGASLYYVRDDKTGGYYAISDGTRSVLYTTSGTFVDGDAADAKGNPTTVTRVIVNNTKYFTEEDVRISDFVDFDSAGEVVEFKPSEFVRKDEESGDTETLYVVFMLRYCYDGSAVSRKQEGRLYYFTETKSWMFVDEAKYQAAIAEYGEKSSNLVLAGVQIADTARSVNLSAALISSAPEKTETDAEQTTAPTP